ncbi:IgGFc-binding protein-like [Mytilus edulis]|uniref:IgGFc-binding protein-like n=1 Tax=Mytilus edulis TaxID=6550 RepID=UPI0039EF3EDB
MIFSFLNICAWICIVQIARGALDNRGTKFLVAFMDNKITNQDIPPELFITTDSKQLVHVNISSPGFHHSSRLHESFTVKQGQVHLTQLHTSYRLNHTQLAKKAILIQSDHEIVVYGVNRELHSDDGYLALPVDALGKEYYTISYAPSYYYTLFTVIGTAHHTNVAIQLPNTPGLNVTLKGITYHQNEWINLTLNIYSTLEISSVADLTGSHIISDKPVGVLSGNKKAVVGNTGGSRDHLVEMLLPVDSWGKNFATVPIPERYNVGDIFKFVASEDNTIITVTGMDHGVQFNDKFTIAKAGQSIQKHYSSGLYSHVVSDKPIALYQFSLTQKGGPDHADPSLITIPPIEQYAAHYTFTTPEYSLGNYTNYFMFIVNGNQKNGLRLDNHPLPSNTTYHKIPGSNLVAGYVGISVGTHTVNHINDTMVIGGILFGKAKLESYGFPVGLLLTPVNSGCQAKAMDYGDEIDNDCDGEVDEEECDGKDDDGDGRVDEDCRCCAPQVVVGRRRKRNFI